MAMNKIPGKDMQTINGGNGRNSIGILPSLGPPIDGLPSLAEYGTNPTSNAVDSSLV